MEWSVDGQSPAFLATTRMMTLQRKTIAAVLESLSLKPGMSVLDVGCGSGEYAFRLGAQTEGIHYTGLDYDSNFVDFATRRVKGEFDYPFEAPNDANTYSFIQGDGLNLPFETGTFDAVVSHTYLTALPDWASALAEMCRVCKTGGVVSSITSMTDDFYGTGTIGLFSSLLQPEDAKLLSKIDVAYKKLHKPMDMTSGIAPRKVPVAFDWIGLKDVSCKALGHYFCLSDAEISIDEYVRNVDLMHAMQLQEATNLKKSYVANCDITEQDWISYFELIDKRRDDLLNQAGNNHEWNWYGASSLFVCGIVPDASMNQAMEEFREAQVQARSLGGCLEELALPHSTTTKQLNIGRCIVVTIEDSDGKTISVSGFDPQQALEEAYSAFINAKSPSVGNHDLDMFLRNESHFKQVEKDAEQVIDEKRFDDLPKWYAYAFPQVWETAAEAAQQGISVEFADASSMFDFVAIACRVQSHDGAAIKIAVHDNPQTATYRALARALGALIN